MRYVIPITFTGRSAHYKATIGTTNNGRNERHATVEIEAPSDAAAYHELCRRVKPDDSRLIARKDYLKTYAVKSI
jgi:hypothetical protein